MNAARLNREIFATLLTAVAMWLIATTISSFLPRSGPPETLAYFFDGVRPLVMAVLAAAFLIYLQVRTEPRNVVHAALAGVFVGLILLAVRIDDLLGGPITVREF